MFGAGCGISTPEHINHHHSIKLYNLHSTLLFCKQSQNYLKYYPDEDSLFWYTNVRSILLQPTMLLRIGVWSLRGLQATLYEQYTYYI